MDKITDDICLGDIPEWCGISPSDEKGYEMADDAVRESARAIVADLQKIATQRRNDDGT